MKGKQLNYYKLHRQKNDQFDCFSQHKLRLQLHGTIYRPDSFVLMLRYCANLKAIRCESTNLNRIVADKSHHVIVALDGLGPRTTYLCIIVCFT